MVAYLICCSVVAGELHVLGDGYKAGKSEKLYSLTGTTGSLMYMAPEVKLPCHSSERTLNLNGKLSTKACTSMVAGTFAPLDM